MTLRPHDDSLGGQAPGPSPLEPRGAEHWLDDPASVELLVRYDEASADDLARLESDPARARILDRLRAVDRWLERAAGDRDGGGAVDAPHEVTAEELFDHARPGDGVELDEERRAALEAHLAAHPEEQRWVRSLQADPPAPARSGVPSPLEWVPDAARADVSEDDDTQAAGPRRFPAWVAWTPLAAAALVLAMALGGSARRSLLDGALPDSPVLRSARSTALLFPRGRVIEAAPGSSSYLSAPLFEVLPQDGASAYRFEVRRGTDSAFDEGEILWESESKTHRTTAQTLPPGGYAWSAWAVIDGLERSLGTQYVTVVAGATLPAGLVERARGAIGADEDAIRTAVRELHAAGFVTDARFCARALPPSDERDSYLGLP